MAADLLARQVYDPGEWCSSDAEQCSALTIGRVMLRRMAERPAKAWAAVADATAEPAANWG
jgi:hypothetical protein